jgi:hypothetical protein
MSSFIELIDTYISNYSTYPNGKIEFECKYGDLVFYKAGSRALIVHAIYIFPEYRQCGLCRGIIEHLIDNVPRTFKLLRIQSVISKVLYEYLMRFRYKNRGFRLQSGQFEYTL